VNSPELRLPDAMTGNSPAWQLWRDSAHFSCRILWTYWRSASESLGGLLIRNSCHTFGPCYRSSGNIFWHGQATASGDADGAVGLRLCDSTSGRGASIRPDPVSSRHVRAHLRFQLHPGEERVRQPRTRSRWAEPVPHGLATARSTSVRSTVWQLTQAAGR